jgi:4-amino-4-deoxy-L-arabinose transferase-like glycosyltransferase/membrane-associated phospholipid phosphatase
LRQVGINQRSPQFSNLSAPRAALTAYWIAASAVWPAYWRALNIIAWLQAVDTALFRFVNQSLANPVFDWLMPKLAGQRLFIPVLLVIAFLLLWKGGRRGRLFLLCFGLGITLTDGLVCNTIKHAVGRTRPCIALADTRCLIGCDHSGSMPSSHAANWFAAAIICFICYRRSWRIMVPAAGIIAFSRVYDGVHYPGDVLVGAILGAGCAGAAVWSANQLWQWAGQKWFPLWWEQMPSLILPEAQILNGPEHRLQAQAGTAPAADAQLPTRKVLLDAHWLRLGYIFVAALFIFRIGYLRSGVIELSNDEAYQWLWSKHLAWSYYSKPPGIALIQWAGTSLWGDTQFGVRFFSPVFAALFSLVILRFMAREVGARQGFLLLLILTSAPMMSAGTILMTIDPPLVLCWTVAMAAGWRAVQPEGATKQWMLAGAAAGLGFLCKYSAAYLVICWTLFFILWRPARVHLKKPGPYLALLIMAFCTLPVIIWNAKHGWITARHVAENAGLASKWQPTFRYFGEFLLVEAALLGPFFFVGALWAMAAFWKHRRTNALNLYFFCLGGVVFLGHWAYSLHSRVQPNWIAPAVVPMYCMMVLYWDGRWQEGLRAVKGWFACGLAFGLGAVVLLHNTDVIGKIAGQPLPGDVDPLRRVLGYKETAAYVEQARENLLREGRPVFIICDHYGITGLFSFYLPEARAALRGQPLVYPKLVPEPNNQFYLWPEYRYTDLRKGENAIYVIEPGSCQLERGWPWKWLTGKEPRLVRVPPPVSTPPLLLRQFESVTDLDVHEVKLGGRVMKRVQLFECRNLR